MQTNYPAHHAGKFNRRNAKIIEMIPPGCFNVMDEHDWIVGGRTPDELDHSPSKYKLKYSFAPAKKKRYF